MRVLRISHSAVVDAWRERERAITALGIDVHLISAESWDEGGEPVRLVPRPREQVEAVPTIGTHPALFLYDPRPLWRALGRTWDLLDIHEEPYALATAEVLVMAALRRCRAPYVLYSAQNLDKRLPSPFRWIQRRILSGARGISVCNTAAGELVRRRGFAGVPDVIPLGVHVRMDGAPLNRNGPHGRVIGYAGRLAAHKGVDLLLDAVAGLPHATLVVAGAGPGETAAAAAFSRARRIARSCAGSPGRGVSSIPAGRVSNLSPSMPSRSARRGEAEARTRRRGMAGSLDPADEEEEGEDGAQAPQDREPHPGPERQLRHPHVDVEGGVRADPDPLGQPGDRRVLGPEGVQQVPQGGADEGGQDHDHHEMRDLEPPLRHARTLHQPSRHHAGSTL